MVRVKPNTEFQVAKELRTLFQGDVMVTFGEYDIICRLTCDSVQELSHVIQQQVRKLENIIKTSTLIGVDEEENARGGV